MHGYLKKTNDTVYVKISKPNQEPFSHLTVYIFCSPLYPYSTAQSGRVSPDSGVDNSVSGQSHNVNQQQSYNDDDSFEATEDDEYRVIGTATALYGFDGNPYEPPLLHECP